LKTSLGQWPEKIESEKVFPLFFPICDISTVLD